MWARIDGDRVAEITNMDPEGRFHPSLVWVECGEEVQPGWTYDGDEFAPPEAKEPEPLPPQYPRLTALEMLALFTPEERHAITAAAMSNVDIKIWYDDLIAATYVTYEDPRTESGLQALVDADLITPESKAAKVAAMQPQET